MSRALIIYGSTTGNTESIAEEIEAVLSGAGVETVIRNAADISAAENLAEGFDAVLMGCSCWGDEEIELQEDFVPLAEKFSEMGLKGKMVAAFASGDSSYQHYCAAVDVIEAAARENGASLIAEGLRVEGAASDAPDDVRNFAEEIAKALAS